MAQPSSWFCDRRGNPSRWVALGLAVLFGLATVTVALLGEGYTDTTVLALLFVACFDAAFGRRPALVLVASAFARRGKGSN